MPEKQKDPKPVEPTPTPVEDSPVSPVPPEETAEKPQAAATEVSFSLTVQRPGKKTYKHSARVSIPGEATEDEFVAIVRSTFQHSALVGIDEGRLKEVFVHGGEERPKPPPVEAERRRILQDRQQVRAERRTRRANRGA